MQRTKDRIKKFAHARHAERYSAGIVRYATIFSFASMLLLWEIELMRVISKIDSAKIQLSARNIMELMTYDSTMVIVAIFTFLSSGAYLLIYEEKKFGVISLLLSAAILIFVRIMN